MDFKNKMVYVLIYSAEASSQSLSKKPMLLGII